MGKEIASFEASFTAKARPVGAAIRVRVGGWGLPAGPNKSWRELLIDIKQRGLEIAPDLAVGDGALGFWKAIEVFPSTRHQRCWVHKTANVLNKVALSVQVNMKVDLREIYAAPTRAAAEAAIDVFADKCNAKQDKAVLTPVMVRRRLTDGSSITSSAISRSRSSTSSASRSSSRKCRSRLRPARLRAQSSKLYHLGFRSAIARNTLANANAVRDWRIYADFAQHLIGIARRLYANDLLALDLAETVYVLDSTTIDLCLSVFPWAPFRSTKAAVKLHTLLDLRGSIPYTNRPNAWPRIKTGSLR